LASFLTPVVPQAVRELLT